MYQLITSKGRKSAETLEALAAWLLEMQPSSTRIVHGDLEAEVEWSDDGSAIVEADGCWDYRADGCESACMRGSVHDGCRCAA